MAADPHEKVVWFDISVDEVLCVYIFNPADHLKTKKTAVKYLTNVSNLFQIHHTQSLTCLHVNPNGPVNSSSSQIAEHTNVTQLMLSLGHFHNGCSRDVIA